ncbi:UNVERIFIED_ORG: ParB family protein of integrating conjugative element (PFGI_1 class) [Pseudomonas psychrophila]
MKPTLVQTIKEKLLQPGFETKAPTAERMSDPIVDTPMLLSLDEVLPYDTNPRTTRNPKYDEIKQSIRQRGLDTPPPITRKPGEDKYRIRNGGNTRLAILNELHRETGDEKFFKFHCLFRPWDAVRGEIISLTGHLAENDLQGQLKFIERAVGVDKARELYEAESGQALSQRELARRLAADGYPVSQPHISRMQDTIRYLLPAVPTLLYSGLGFDRVTKLLGLRKCALASWVRFYNEDGRNLEFDSIFHEVLALFEGDAEEFLLSRFQDELVDQLKKPLGLTYENVLLAITQSQDELRRSTPVIELPIAPLVIPIGDQKSPPETLANPQGTPTVPSNINSIDQTQPPIEPKPQVILPPAPEDQQARLDGHIVSPVTTSARVLKVKQQLAAIEGEELPDFNANALVAIPVQAGGLHPISDLWYIEREIDAPDQLRRHIAQLAQEIVDSVNAPGEIQIIQGGIGFSYRHPEQETEVTPTAQRTLLLLQSMSGSMALVLNLIQQKPELQVDALADFEFAAGLGQLLLGQPTTQDQHPNDTGRLSDGALVKLFRIVRLARRLIDLEIRSSTDPALQTDR